MKKDSNYKTSVNGFAISFSKSLCKWVAKRGSVKIVGGFDEVKRQCKQQV